MKRERKHSSYMVLILSNSIFQIGLFDDLRAYKNICIINAQQIKPKTVIEKIKRKILDKFRQIDEKKFKEITGIKLFKRECQCIMLDTGVLSYYSLAVLNRLKKKYNIKLVLLVLNSWDAASPHLVNHKSDILSNVWDGVYSYDYKDCKRFGWNHIGLSYFSSQLLNPVNTNKIDMYFIGGLKGNRESLITDVFNECQKNQVLCLMDVFKYNSIQLNEKIVLPDSSMFDIHDVWLPYRDVLKKISESNCILEILQGNQKTQSIRYFEAIAYNKKLLTNNPNIFNMPYYDKRYMKYFRTVKDIDFEWVKKEDTPIYNYQGEFSPRELIQRIIREQNIVIDL